MIKEELKNKFKTEMPMTVIGGLWEKDKDIIFDFFWTHIEKQAETIRVQKIYIADAVGDVQKLEKQISRLEELVKAADELVNLIIENDEMALNGLSNELIDHSLKCGGALEKYRSLKEQQKENL